MSDVTGVWEAQGGAWSVLVHGGAGDVPDAAIARHVAGCEQAAARAAETLAQGGSALDAVQRAVEALEDDACFNAGTGACLNAEGQLELDASIMEGDELAAGAVCALPPFRHPIAIARAVLEEGRHVLYAAGGADAFARGHGFAPAAAGEMISEAARTRLARMKAGTVGEGWAGDTVGAVARDASGRVAAATSTGGRVGKAVGRVGDAPLIGAGTYADREAGACSGTGDGEAFIRVCAAKTVTTWLAAGVAPRDAASGVIRHLIERGKGDGGVILVDRRGRLAWARSTRTMTWAAASEGWGRSRSGA